MTGSTSLASRSADAMRRPRAVIARGRTTLRVEIRDFLDTVVASDPGLTRLRQGLRAVIAVGTTALLESVLAKLLGIDPLIAVSHVLLGSVIALNLAAQTNENRRRNVVRAAFGAPIAAGITVTTAVLLTPHHFASLAAFVLVTFLAVYLRRFGPRVGTWAFVGWQSYFFTMFLRPPLSQLPGILVAVVVSTTWTVFLLLTVLYDDPRKRLQRTVTGLRARARSVIAVCLDVLDEGTPRQHRILRRELVRLSEAVLLFDGQLADSRSVPDGIGTAPLRRWSVELEIGIEEVANSIVDLAARDDVPAEVVGAVRQMLTEVGWGSDVRERIAALREPPASDYQPVRRLAAASDALVRLVGDWTSGRTIERARDAASVTGAVAPLIGGRLPGTQEVAAIAVSEEDAPWWRPAGWRFSTRQAVQAATAAALAIGIGDMISPRRFYWAAIAAFVSFIGTATAGETVRKGIARIAGTFAGLIGAMLLARVSEGNTTIGLGLLLLSIFLGFYFAQLSQTVMVFFLTLMLGQLYGLLQSFSDAVLLLRLEETAVGALAGILVALVVLPTSTRDTLIVARQKLLGEIADLLDDCAERLLTHQGRGDQLLTDAMEVEASARMVAQGARTMQRPRFVDDDAGNRAHRMAVLAVLASYSRALVPVVLAARDDDGSESVVPALRALSREARRLADLPNLRDQPPRPGVPPISEEVAGLLTDSPAQIVLVRRTLRVADTLALLTPRGR